MTSRSETSLEGVDFLDLIAHELRQPLTAARGSLSMLTDPERSPRLTDADRALLFDIVGRNLEQLAALIQSLRVFSEADRGELELVVGPTSLEDLFQECLQDYPDARTKRKLSAQSPPGLEIRVDRVLFKQVLANLVGNAIKFSPPGSSVWLVAHKRGEQIVIEVSDTGPGFPSDQRERIFEKSVRLVSGASGLGLGLYVARAIVNAHNGRLQASSDAGHGSTFEVAIPA